MSNFKQLAIVVLLMSFQGKIYTKILHVWMDILETIHLITLDIIAICYARQFCSIINYLPLSSTIVTVTWLWSPTTTLWGREEGLITRVNDSGASNDLSLMIWISNTALLVSGGIVTLNGPGT